MKTFSIHPLLVLLAIGLFGMAASVGVVSAETGDWQATYWNNRELKGTPVLERNEDFIYYHWGQGSPSPLVNRDSFSARWTRTLDVSAGTYRFEVNADDGMRVYIDGTLLIDAWYDTNDSTISNLIYLTSRPHEVVVEYYEAGGNAIAQLSYDKVLRGDDETVGGVTQSTPWTAHYYDNPGLRGNPPIVRQDQTINFDWGTGSPAEGIPEDAFSVRWQNDLTFSPGRYRFTFTVDDGVRLHVNGKQILNEWRSEQTRTVSAEATIYGGTIPVIVEYFEGKGEARISMTWTLLYPIGQGSEAPTNPEPVSATGQMNARTALRRTYGFDAPPIGFAEFEEVVQLAGQRNADTTWIRVISVKGVWGWVPADSFNTNFPLETLDVWQDNW